MKGIAIPYLIALILGVIILAIAVYLIYKSIKNGGLDCQDCRSKFVAWCSGCSLIPGNMGKPSWTEKGSELGKTLYDCVTKCGFWTGASGSDQNCAGAQDTCKAMGVSF
jgi:hypothetical protein